MGRVEGHPASGVVEELGLGGDGEVIEGGQLDDQERRR